MKFLKVINSKATILVSFVVSVFAVIINFSMMHSYVYIDMALFNGFCLTLSIFFLLSITLNFALIVCKFKGIKYKDKFVSDYKFYNIITCINIVFAALFVVLDIVNLALNSEALYMIWLNFSKIAPLVSVAILVLFLLFFFSTINDKKSKIIVASVLCGIIFCHTLFAIFPISIYKFEASPMVVDNGKGYSIVFATTDKGTGYVEYEYNGKIFKVYDEIDGKKNSSKIHTIKVPYKHIDGNSYVVGSSRVIQELSYGGRLGKNISSSKYNFNAPKEDLNILTISDWHTHNSKVKKSLNHLGEFNSVIMLGDSAAGITYEEEVVKYIVKLGGDITNGAMPIIWIRGNHETRGAAAKNISKYLGLDKFYYTVNLGNINIVALDSGEDKVDSHPEYGGMNDFENYRKDMVDWLESLPNDFGKNIVLSHSVEICIENDLQTRAMAKLEQLGSSLIVGGHTHVVEFNDSKAIKTYVDGGYNDGKFVASKLSIVGNNMKILAVDNKGNIVYENNLGNIFLS